MRPKLRPRRIPQTRVTHIATTFFLVEVAEAEGFEPPVPLGTLAFKTQGNRVMQCAPGCLPARFFQDVCRTVQRMAVGCYTTATAPQLHGSQSRSGYGPARAGLGGLAAGPVLVLAESV